MNLTSRATAGQSEHVHLVSDELEEVEAQTINAELEHVTKKTRLRVVIFNHGYLGIRSDNARAVRDEYWLNLAFLDPHPVRQTDRAWLIMAAAAGTVTVVTFALIKSSWAGPLSLSLVLINLLMLAATFASLATAVHHSANTLVFLTRHGRVPVLRLPSSNGNRDQLQCFVRQLRAAALHAQYGYAGVRGHLLRDEMKEHRRLLEGGVLQASQFESARRLILDAHG